MLHKVSLLLIVQPGKAGHRLRIIPPETQRAPVFDNNQTEEEEEEGQAFARVHVRRF